LTILSAGSAESHLKTSNYSHLNRIASLINIRFKHGWEVLKKSKKRGSHRKAFAALHAVYHSRREKSWRMSKTIIGYIDSRTFYN
jgi:hypothetical protein